ncbi:TonB family protein [Hephaestia sp. GCM10023244]|uniref:energy transducer TonB n=1 Tax=unclassified Hephaestia TaxID=2631281 RepID=UPI002076D9E2|nr:energy transducer TonB [Hephaestia sp. MAHUQ-44]MCM8731457.1 TonB family protein [Hephaestia sp. MAHUQ-44]
MLLLQPLIALALAGTASPVLAQSAPEASTPAPIGNPADWFAGDSYPPAAKAAGAEGRTGFAVDVDAKGRVTSCSITESSGTALLDSTTCALVVMNGRFSPAHDAAGKAIAGVWTSSMLWKLEIAPLSDDDPLPL